MSESGESQYYSSDTYQSDGSDNGDVFDDEIHDFINIFYRSDPNRYANEWENYPMDQPSMFNDIYTGGQQQMQSYPSQNQYPNLDDSGYWPQTSAYQQNGWRLSESDEHRSYPQHSMSELLPPIGIPEHSMDNLAFPSHLMKTEPRSPGTPLPPSPTINQTEKRKPNNKPLLPDFLADLIKDERYNPTHIRWLNKDELVFLIVKPKVVASMWGSKKGNPNMNYPNMSRGMRDRRKSGFFVSVPPNSSYPKKLTYKWGPKAAKYFT